MTFRRIIFIVLIITAAAAAPAFSKERVAVLDFKAKDVEESDALAIADLFRSDLVGTGKYIVLERGNMKLILEEHKLQMDGLTSEASASEIGELLAVNYLFLGNLSRFGSKYILVIDKINIETGEIEFSVKKNAVNIDDFLELSSEAAEELTGSEIITESEEAASNNYDAATLTELISSIGLSNILGIRTIDINTPAMQSTDLGLRKEIFSDNALDNAIVPLLVNAVTFGIGGYFMQGVDALGWTSVGTTVFLAGSLLSKNTGLITTSAILSGAAWIGGIIMPYIYEAEYNQYLKNSLLVY